MRSAILLTDSNMQTEMSANVPF